MQSNNEGFFFLIDWDGDGRLKNVFWVDPHSRAAYKEFGDVVTFDTTYLINKFDMSFAPFVGVNHRGHSILLGCGLISSKDTKTFVWLFKTWLACMGGVAPQGIINDKDRTMKNAIRVVFPDTKHRLCLRHIMKKMSEKLRSHVEYDGIRRLLLEDNVWLSSLYTERELWKTILKQFVEQYSKAFRKNIEKESQADFNSFHKQLSCATFYYMEKHIQKLYTARKFLQFQKELTGMMYCGFKSIDRREYLTHYVLYGDVVFGEGGKKNVMFDMMYDDKYVLTRWRKYVRRCNSHVKINYDGWTLSNEQRRYDDMCRSFSRLANVVFDNEGSSNSNDSIVRRGKGRPRSVMKRRIFKKRSMGSSSGAAGSLRTNDISEF
ncbi:protein FAR1-RELATED SEQUENCE 5-like [Tripterygium wilfordii]|uniref:protein FAR1-RELATED SEQUENCE 5-like n=1 Tax=Tripterygium wilfordii TaxID=458696 RepID=UPI0018F850CF|nr:protein FAR1-RELATED SEQUENCE 5-like [Tripterygium wilfordii]